jgi:hypothetical protein
MSEEEKTLLDTQFKAQVQHIFSQLSLMEENMGPKTGTIDEVDFTNRTYDCHSMVPKETTHDCF